MVRHTDTEHRLFNYAVVQLAPIMINKIAWKIYFVFFCFNLCFIPIVSQSSFKDLRDSGLIEFCRYISSFLSPMVTSSRF